LTAIPRPLLRRYAWENGAAKGTKGCCGNNPNATTTPCPLASCPLMATWPGSGGAAEGVTLPANPFIAHIVGGRCKCVMPQTCDE